MTHCPNCGRDLAPGATACVWCRATVAFPAAGPGAPAPAAARAAAPAPKRTIIVGAIGAVAFVVAIAVIALLVSGSSGGRPPVEASGPMRPGVPGTGEPITRRDAPIAGDHWHDPYAISVCGVEQPASRDRSRDEVGIHTHTDGLIHIHPFDPWFEPEDATLGAFTDVIGLDLSPRSLRLASGRVVDSCDGEPGRVRVYRWSLDDPEREPEVFDDDFASIHFDHNHEAYVISFASDDAIPPKPSSIKRLETLGG